jgi:hypothetical protein
MTFSGIASVIISSIVALYQKKNQKAFSLFGNRACWFYFIGF